MRKGYRDNLPLGRSGGRTTVDATASAGESGVAQNENGATNTNTTAWPSAGFWHQQIGPPPSPASSGRLPLEGTTDADVCIVGAGYTGLWTAWGLLQNAPDLRVVLVEAQHAGYGASGRNGGWLSGLLPGSRDRLAAGPAGRAGVVVLQRALIDAVTSVGRIVASEEIDCDYHAGGTMQVARNHAQLARLRAGVEEDRLWGLDEADVSVLDRAAAGDRVRVAGTVGAVYSPHCARIQPAKLVRGLAAAVERRGAVIHERSPAVSFSPGEVLCRGGKVRAPWVVLALEGYNASMPGRHRRLLPMNSSMIVTNPLPPEAWGAIGWHEAETVSDGAHAYVYLQRTGDGRIAIGGRGVPYRYGSRAALDSVAGLAAGIPSETVASLEAALARMFPSWPGDELRAAAGWSGVLGVARDWCPSIVVQPEGRGARAGGGSTARAGAPTGGFAAAGGYVGDGVTTSHLAGLTLADLILGLDTERTRLPWVGRRSRDWEPEPLRWLGVRTVYGLYRAADRAEARHPDRARASLWSDLAGALAGR